MNQSLSHEDVLIALDQLDQTVEVMGNIIKRLKRGIDESITAPITPTTSEPEHKSHPPLSGGDTLADPNLH
ncbi:MAG: hypothetical protein ACRBBW_12440 [Cellvibrionaceae bacterium]